MRDVIRMASHAFHYLAVFDDHHARPLYLGRARRIASPDQRLVLYANDRGCSHPGCDVPGYLCDVHHVREWAQHGQTDIDQLTFACGSHHRLVKPGAWTTRKRRDSLTEWIPPPHIPRKRGDPHGGRPRTNVFHHPEKILGGRDDGAG